MKIDRFAKILLLVIALLLSIHIFTMIDTPIERTALADPAPSFIQVGKEYSECHNCDVRWKVLKIGSNGWIYVEATRLGQGARSWHNTNEFKVLFERTP